jgi:hypothetical protein
MVGFALSLLCLRLLSVVLGGYGIFCVIMSLSVPSVGAEAFVLLSTATAIFFYAVLASLTFSHCVGCSELPASGGKYRCMQRHRHIEFIRFLNAVARCRGRQACRPPSGLISLSTMPAPNPSSGRNPLKPFWLSSTAALYHLSQCTSGRRVSFPAFNSLLRYCFSAATPIGYLPTFNFLLIGLNHRFL